MSFNARHDEARKRVRVRELDRVAELRVLWPLGRLVHVTNSPMARRPEPALADHYRNMLPVGLRFINALLRDGRPLIAGDRPTIVDCALAATLDFGRQGGPALDEAINRCQVVSVAVIVRLLVKTKRQDRCTGFVDRCSRHTTRRRRR
jgi:glutathione S-transferase